MVTYTISFHFNSANAIVRLLADNWQAALQTIRERYEGATSIQLLKQS